MPTVDVHMLINALDNVCVMGGSYCPYLWPGKCWITYTKLCGSFVMCCSASQHLCVTKRWNVFLNLCYSSMFPSICLQKCQNWHMGFPQETLGLVLEGILSLGGVPINIALVDQMCRTPGESVMNASVLTHHHAHRTFKFKKWFDVLPFYVWLRSMGWERQASADTTNFQQYATRHSGGVEGFSLHTSFVYPASTCIGNHTCLTSPPTYQ